MPLDGYSYLTSYGWSGRGAGLRKGAIDRPIAIPQKRNLAGVGKDRDEAFPFWDHLFTAASKAITIKVTSDDEEKSEVDAEEEVLSKTQLIDLKRTSTGIISNRRPTSGTPASGSVTPDPNADSHLSLIAAAKREAVKRGLYSRFFRGPVLGPDSDPSTSTTPTTSSSPTPGSNLGEVKKKRRKSEDRVETKEEKRERKRLKRERKEAKALKKAAQRDATRSCSGDSADEDDRQSENPRERERGSETCALRAPKKNKKRKDGTTETIPIKSKGGKRTREPTIETDGPPPDPISRSRSDSKKSKQKYTD